MSARTCGESGASARARSSASSAASLRPCARKTGEPAVVLGVVGLHFEQPAEHLLRVLPLPLGEPHVSEHVEGDRSVRSDRDRELGLDSRGVQAPRLEQREREPRVRVGVVGIDGEHFRERVDRGPRSTRAEVLHGLGQCGLGHRNTAPRIDAPKSASTYGRSKNATGTATTIPFRTTPP